ncbi:hypothetical protein ACEUW3_07665 [Staphylococcus pseudintermedius]|uniref:Phage protein n=1 Tax=Staphylococcus intermedius NCTC 11048 TaxID=1141106 RepID=A0A380G9R0_STAIN|nr:hypothetical protein [Staphylococcus intermedius]PCF87417.1 hypothetical protein B4W76_03235 [Staphylococcus intermedius]PNZ52251.1 hypothetical protein CD138_07010 [Staphylococcus intermedius NCTC 11048]SUM47080.1 Uncharacterised protein [Staphylococcus intermedius NCTC 11048]
MKTIPALAFEFKDRPGVYIGTFDGETTNIEEAVVYALKTGKKPDKEKAKNYYLELGKLHKKQLLEEFGENAINNFDTEKWFELCNLVDVQISEEHFREMLENDY